MEDYDYSVAAEVILRGGVIAYPTECVWGFGCDPWNAVAVDTIFSLKGRRRDKGLIIVAADHEQISPLLRPLSPHLQERLQTPVSRPTTWLIPDDHHWIPQQVKGNYNTIAVRVSQHPVVRALCLAVGQPIVSTSANLAGEIALVKYADVASHFGEELDFIVPGETGGASLASTIVDLVTETVIR